MISVDSEKSFGTIQDTFPIKTLSKTGIKGNFLNQMKSNYEKHIGSIIFNGEELNGFPLRSITYSVPARLHHKNITWIITGNHHKTLLRQSTSPSFFPFTGQLRAPSLRKANELAQAHQLLVPNLSVLWLSIKRKQNKKDFQILFEKFEHQVMWVLFPHSNNQLKQSRGVHTRLAWTVQLDHLHLSCIPPTTEEGCLLPTILWGGLASPNRTRELTKRQP